MSIKRDPLSSKKCCICGELIPLRRVLNSSPNTVCSNLCGKKYRYNILKLSRQQSRQGKHYYCKTCGKEILNLQQVSMDFCSQSCRTKYQHKMNPPRPTEYYDCVCKTCGTHFTLNRSQYLQNKTHFCGVECYNQAHSSSVTLENITSLVLKYYNATGETLTIAGISNEFHTTKKVIENRVGTLTNFYASLGIIYSPTSGRTASRLFYLIDTTYNWVGLREKSFDTCVSRKSNKLRFDYFVQDLNLLIEYQGKQHYHSTFSESAFLSQQENDEIKRGWCRANGYTLVEWNYKTPVNKKEVLRILNPYVRKPIKI